MLDHDLIDMLDSEDVDDRIFAVKAMAKSKDPDYLQYLSTVYRTDEDAEVKELALKAGKYIKKLAVEENWTGTGIEGGTEDEYEEIEVSGANKERADGMVQQALDLNLRGENERATELLRKAITLNPNLKHDSYTISLAGNVTGYQDEMAIAYLEKEDDRKQKKKRGGGQDDVTWGEALIDLSIYWLVLGGTIVVGLLLLVRAASDAAPATENPEDFRAVFSGFGLVAILLISFGIGLMYTIYLLIQNFAIHIAATNIFAGDSTLPGLIHRTIYYQIGIILAGVVVVGIVFAGVLANPILLDAETPPELDPFGSMVLMIYGLGSLIAAFWYASLVGKNYDFGMGKGCMAIIAGGIILAIFQCVCSAIGQFIALSAFAGSSVPL